MQLNLSKMKLTRNIGWLDKFLRYGISVILISLHLTGVVEGTIGTITLVLAGLFLVTGILRFCPLYSLLGVSTGKSEEKPPGKY